MSVASGRIGTERDRERLLVRRMIAGDEGAFEEFADDYIPALYRFAATRLNHDRELTREIAQTTLVKAIGNLASFRGEASLMTWLCACCKTEIAAHFRRRGTRPPEVEWTEERAAHVEPAGRADDEGPEGSALRGEEARLVHAALDLLPPRHARVLECKYLHGLPVKEIADRMKLTTKATESLLTRARNSFREAYARLQTGSRHEGQ